MSIYKICHEISDKIYVGSTKRSINKRMYAHKTHSLYPDIHKCKLYDLMRQYNREGFSIECLEECSEDILREREQHYINELKPELNSIKSFITVDEKREYEKLRQQQDRVRKYKRDYYTKTREKVLAKSKQICAERTDEERERKRIYMKEWRAKKN